METSPVGKNMTTDSQSNDEAREIFHVLSGVPLG
jgi:hypothetical protein